MLDRRGVMPSSKEPTLKDLDALIRRHHDLLWDRLAKLERDLSHIESDVRHIRRKLEGQE